MAIFNSYVSLPEGSIHVSQSARHQPRFTGMALLQCCFESQGSPEGQDGPGMARPLPPTSELPRCWLCRVDSARGWDTRWTCLELSQLGMAWEWSWDLTEQSSKPRLIDEYIRELYYRICWGLSQSTNWEIVATSQYKGTTEGFKYC